jgi:branched-chain amino acid transport system permease protein
MIGPGLSARLSHAAPILIVIGLMLAGLVLIGSPQSWLTLTVAGLAMGMMIFIMASGMTLVFGLMDVINFGHGAFISAGAFIGITILAQLTGLTAAGSLFSNILAVLIAIAGAMAATAVIGYVFEKLIIQPVYGHHLKQILTTMGGLIIAEQLIYVFWGPDAIYAPRPDALKGSVMIFGAAIEKYRLLAVGIGILLFLGMRYVLNSTKIGLLVRAGVENGEMVEALGYRIGRLFILVFMTGSALAGLGGVMWALYEETITAQMGNDIMIHVFITIIIGGLGSVGGSFVGALIAGLLANYAAFLFPKLALVSNIALMVIILMWRPQGLYPVVRTK